MEKEIEFTKLTKAASIKGTSRNPAIWGWHKNRWVPLVYFRRPKWASQESFDKFVKALSFTVELEEVRFKAKKGDLVGE